MGEPHPEKGSEDQRRGVRTRESEDHRRWAGTQADRQFGASADFFHLDAPIN